MKKIYLIHNFSELCIFCYWNVMKNLNYEKYENSIKHYFYPPAFILVRGLMRYLINIKIGVNIIIVVNMLRGLNSLKSAVFWETSLPGGYTPQTANLLDYSVKSSGSLDVLVDVFESGFHFPYK